MPNFAVIDGNKVINVIVAETKEDAESVTKYSCIEYTVENPAGIGFIWNGSNFEEPQIEEIISE